MDELTQAMSMAIKKVANKTRVIQTLTGTARNVRETLCNVEREGSPALLDCRLNAIDDNLQSYVTIVPTEGSNVIVGIIENLKTEAIVLRCSEVEKVNLKIGEQTLMIDKNGFIFNNGSFGGLVKVGEMVDWMSKLHNDLQALQTQLLTHPTAGNGAALGLVFNPTTPNPQISTFENSKIKQ